MFNQAGSRISSAQPGSPQGRATVGQQFASRDRPPVLPREKKKRIQYIGAIAVSGDIARRRRPYSPRVATWVFLHLPPGDAAHPYSAMQADRATIEGECIYATMVRVPRTTMRTSYRVGIHA